ncbi:MAG: hypothetical protein CMO68_06080 [Verrucomicrobiales bacterium]|nr:hypothetical protein [Verrucomicrobiales bacterium]|tara:strand:+ start:504 stop:743 length:240 start_codon:yes stop_codon:yes gene_type:complete
MKLKDLKTGDRFKYAAPMPDENPEDVFTVFEQCRRVDERGEYLRPAWIVSDWGLAQPIVPRQMVDADTEVFPQPKINNP